MENAIIICSRLNSTRIPRKALRKINGKPIIEHILDRQLKYGFNVVMAVPAEERDLWFDTINKYGEKVLWYFGFKENPMERMLEAAKLYDVKTIVRQTHDKIFLDPDQIKYALEVFGMEKVDYLTSSSFIAGTAFEVFTREVLERAVRKFKEENIEHITYAIKAVTDKVKDLAMFELWPKDMRLLIDFPEDLELMECLMGSLGNDCSLKDVLNFIKDNPWAKNFNRLPDVTIYTCAYNGEAYIREAINSVISLRNFRKYEFILVDDCSSDKTSLYMNEVASYYPNVKYIRNAKNLGLASSSNVALASAKGKYIVRLDADDYFIGNNSIEVMLDEIESKKLDALYPNFYEGNFKTIGLGASHHHPAGTLFKTLALNHLRFKEGLRGYDGLELYKRAKEQLKIGYLNRPIFFYRQHEDSLSKNNLEERVKIKQEIENNKVDFHPV